MIGDLQRGSRFTTPIYMGGPVLGLPMRSNKKPLPQRRGFVRAPIHRDANPGTVAFTVQGKTTRIRARCQKSKDFVRLVFNANDVSNCVTYAVSTVLVFLDIVDVHQHEEIAVEDDFLVMDFLKEFLIFNDGA